MITAGTGATSGGILINGIIADGGAGGKVGLNPFSTSTSATQLNAPNNYTGSTTVRAGTLTLNGANGALALSVSPLTINGGIFNIGDGSATAGSNNNNRIDDAQAFTLSGIISFSSAVPNTSFVLRGTAIAATSTAETIGAIARPSGSGIITVTFGATNTATLTAASLTHNPGEPTTMVNGVGLGKNDSATVSVARFFLTAAPTLVGTTTPLDAGINSSAQNTKIVPYLVGEATTTSGGIGTTSTAGTANTFVTYTGTGGLRPLNQTDEYTTNAYTAGNNIRIAMATAALSSVEINSLLITSSAVSAVSITNGSALAVTSGAVMFAASGEALTGTAGNTLNSASTEGLITVAGAGSGPTISAVITGSGGLTKSGNTNSLLILTGANTYNGTTTAAAGVVDLSNISLVGFGGGTGRNIAVAAPAAIRRTAINGFTLNPLMVSRPFIPASSRNSQPARASLRSARVLKPSPGPILHPRHRH